MKITITRKHDFHDGKTKAIMDVLLEDSGVTIHGVRAVEGPRGIFFAMPSSKYVDKEGKDKYSNHVSMEKDIYFSFQASMKNAYNNYSSQPLPVEQEQTQGTAPATEKYDDDLPF